MDLKAALDRCNQVHDSLAAIEDDLLFWAERRQKLLAGYRKDLRRLREVADELPEDWHHGTAAQVAAACVLGRPVLTRKFCAQYDDSLDREERVLLRSFERRPWGWSLFSVLAPLQGDFYEVAEHLTGDELVMHSPALTTLYREGANLFFTVVFTNGPCYQTFGPLHYHRGLLPFDFEYLARALRPGTYRAHGVRAVVAATPAPFLLLDRWSEIPSTAHGDEPLVTCAHEVALDQFSTSQYTDAADVRSIEHKGKGTLVKVSLKESKPPLESADLYHDAGRGRLVVTAMGMERYRALADLVRDQVELPPAPDWYASMNMVICAQALTGKEYAAVEYDRHFEEPIANRVQMEKELQPIQALMQELSRRRNHGVDYAIEELAELYGVPVDAAHQLEADLERTTAQFHLEISGGLPGHQAPPPETRLKLRHLLVENDLFRLDYGPRARQVFAERIDRTRELVDDMLDNGVDDAAAARALSLERLPRILDDLFFAAWPARDPTLLTYTLYLLCRFGHEPHSTRDYAVEVLRTFWQVLLRGNTADQVDGFIERYTSFCWATLEPLGFVAASARDPIATEPAESGDQITAGPLIGSFVHLSGYWK